MGVNMEPDQNKHLNIETGTVSQNNIMNILEQGTVVDTRYMKITTGDTRDSVDTQCQENNKVTFGDYDYDESTCSVSIYYDILDEDK